MIVESYNLNIIRAKFIKPALVSVPAGAEPQPSSLRKRFSSSSTRCFFFLLLIILILSTPLSAWAKDTSKIESATVQLTAEEQAWLEEHPNIKIGYNSDFEPAVIVDPDGSYRGIVPTENMSPRASYQIFTLPFTPGSLKNGTMKRR
jgi:hypothetical protein